MLGKVVARCFAIFSGLWSALDVLGRLEVFTHLPKIGEEVQHFVVKHVIPAANWPIAVFVVSLIVLANVQWPGWWRSLVMRRSDQRAEPEAAEVHAARVEPSYSEDRTTQAAETVTLWLFPDHARTHIRSVAETAVEERLSRELFEHHANVGILEAKVDRLRKRCEGKTSSPLMPSPAELEQARVELTSELELEEQAREWLEIHRMSPLNRLMGYLESGKYPAQGYASETLEPAERREIPREQWSFLKLDLQEKTAAGKGLIYHHVQIAVGEATPVPASPTA